MTIGERIQALRKAKGLSQEALADAVGVSRQAVSKWELGESQPDVDKVVLLAQVLGVTTDELLLGETPQAAPPTSPPPAQDNLRYFQRFLRKHGYKAGYILMAWGAALVLVGLVMVFVVHSFFGAAQDMVRDPWGDLWPGSYQGGVQFQTEDGRELTPEEQQIILDAIRQGG